MGKLKLSVVLATKNEEQNISACLGSVKNLADEIIVYDEYSTDKTREIAKKFGAKIFKWRHKKNFHETKQKAIDRASGDWILQLDADERTTRELIDEIRRVINSSNEELLKRVLSRPERSNGVKGSLAKVRLFKCHQKLIEEREGGLGKKTGEVVAFFLPRLNYFLGKPLRHAGVYPDGSIRLIKAGFARLPGRSVHEVMEVDGEVGWLINDLEHHESPTLSRYLYRMNRYTDIHSEELKQKEVPTNLFYILLYTCYKPAITFLSLYIRHRGYSDGMRGFIWSALSALHFPIAYFKYWQHKKI